MIAHRVITAFLTHSVFVVTKWERRNGYLDSSGFARGVGSHFERFPEAQERLGVRFPDNARKPHAYCF